MAELTREQIERVKHYGLHAIGFNERSQFLIALCDMALQSLREQPVSRDAVLDTEAIAWAYRKCIAFGLQTSSMDNAMMMDRLQAMLSAGTQP